MSHIDNYEILFKNVNWSNENIKKDLSLTLGDKEEGVYLLFIPRREVSQELSFKNSILEELKEGIKNSLEKYKKANNPDEAIGWLESANLGYDFYEKIKSEHPYTLSFTLTPKVLKLQKLENKESLKILDKYLKKLYDKNSTPKHLVLMIRFSEAFVCDLEKANGIFKEKVSKQEEKFKSVFGTYIKIEGEWFSVLGGEHKVEDLSKLLEGYKVIVARKKGLLAIG